MKYLLPLLILINLVWTDGGVLPPSSGPTGDYEIYSSDQVAIIKILPDSEELSILVKTHWFDNYNGFAWIVPLPALPTVSEVNIDLFTDCAYLTAPRRPSGGCEGPFGTGGVYYGEEGTAGDDYYYVVEYDTIGFLEAVLIYTDLADSLSNWLTNSGYLLPEGTLALFEEYINRDWNYFFIARADTIAAEYYQNVGIKFTFATDEIIYPMKISSISATYTTLYMYVIGEHKMFFDNAELEYANKISRKEFDAIADDFTTLAIYIEAGDYITKLRRIYEGSEQMTSDVSIYQAADDTEYRKVEGEYWYFGFTNSMLLPLLICVFYLVLRELRRKKQML